MVLRKCENNNKEQERSPSEHTEFFDCLENQLAKVRILFYKVTRKTAAAAVVMILSTLFPWRWGGAQNMTWTLCCTSQVNGFYTRKLEEYSGKLLSASPQSEVISTACLQFFLLPWSCLIDAPFLRGPLSHLRALSLYAYPDWILLERPYGEDW